MSGPERKPKPMIWKATHQPRLKTTRRRTWLLMAAVLAPFTVTGTVTPGQVQGAGCVYPASIPTVAGQLSAAGKTWKGYMEDMQTPCQHPEPGAKDDHQGARAGDQYATRHNPFVYFEEITSSRDCRHNVLDFSSLAGDLRSVSSTPNPAYITSNLCNDGHDSPCVDGRPGGTDGGRVGALVLSPLTAGGTTSEKLYNHYSLLATIEDSFSLPRLGYAGAAGLDSFGPDVFNGTP
ncbi:alkaline phosphatase family protein [Arthrobacter sp. PAMC25284]|nr:alkaline phosphatase family protein [Arthrobacter sp. PAMC25284]